MKKKRNRAVSMTELYNTNFKTLAFEGVWNDLIGKPEMKGCWIVWGESFNGKTGLVLKLCKYLSNFGRIVYDTVEEGRSHSFKIACIRENMISCDRKFLMLDKEPIKELKVRLMKKRSPDIIAIDTVQYSGLNKITAKELIDEFPSKLFIFISHAEGKNPEGRTAMSIKRLSDVKIRVEGYRATIQSRYGGDKSLYYTIWEEGARRHYGEVE